MSTIYREPRGRKGTPEEEKAEWEKQTGLVLKLLEAAELQEDPTIVEKIDRGSLRFLRNGLGQRLFIPRTTTPEMVSSATRAYFREAVSGSFPERGTSVVRESGIVLQRVDRRGFPSPRVAIGVVERYGISDGEPKLERQFKELHGFRIRSFVVDDVIPLYFATYAERLGLVSARPAR